MKKKNNLRNILTRESDPLLSMNYYQRNSFLATATLLCALLFISRFLSLLRRRDPAKRKKFVAKISFRISGTVSGVLVFHKVRFMSQNTYDDY